MGGALTNLRKGGPGGFFSDLSKSTSSTGGAIASGLLTGNPFGAIAGALGGFSPLDPLQLGPALFDAPPAPPKPKPPPPPPDEAAPLFRELARADTDRRLRASRGSLQSFKPRTV